MVYFDLVRAYVRNQWGFRSLEGLTSPLQCRDKRRVELPVTENENDAPSFFSYLYDLFKTKGEPLDKFSWGDLVPALCLLGATSRRMQAYLIQIFGLGGPAKNALFFENTYMFGPWQPQPATIRTHRMMKTGNVRLSFVS